jgi:hypothetical protein
MESCLKIVLVVVVWECLTLNRLLKSLLGTPCRLRIYYHLILTLNQLLISKLQILNNLRIYSLILKQLLQMHLSLMEVLLHKDLGPQEYK